MKLRNVAQTYGVVSRLNHWVTALLLFVVILLGELMEEFGDDNGFVSNPLSDLHTSFGVLLMGMLLLRLIWLVIGGRVEALPGIEWQLYAARVVKLVLWTGLVAMPLSGWLMMNAAGESIGLFGLFTLPQIVPESYWLSEVLEEVHETIAGLLIVAVLLHLAGALKHHFIDGDRTLLRMLGSKW